MFNCGNVVCADSEINFSILIFTSRPIDGIVYLFSEDLKTFLIKARALVVHQHSSTKEFLHSDLQQCVKALLGEA